MVSLMMHSSFFTNGHIMVNGEKMSKSLGNFLTLSQAVARYVRSIHTMIRAC